MYCTNAKIMSEERPFAIKNVKLSFEYLHSGRLNKYHNGGRVSHLPVAGDLGSDRPWV